jgi:acyl CoA:acetate/3-ketoacid CoA transferase beta subunit
VSSLQPGLGGASDAVFRADQFIVRVEHADRESVRWERALMQFLAEKIDQVVDPSRLGQCSGMTPELRFPDADQ